MTVYLLLDVDNLPSYRDAIVDAVAAHLCELEPTGTAIVAGKFPGSLDEFVRLLNERFPKVSVVVDRCSAQKNLPDARIVFHLGKICGIHETTATPARVYLLSHDKLVISAALPALLQGIEVVVPISAPTHVLPEKVRQLPLLSTIDWEKPIKPPMTPTGRTIMPPAWYIDACDCVFTRLECLAVPSVRLFPCPRSIPFPRDRMPITIGGGSGSGRSFLDLSPWEPDQKKQRLYSPHAEFLYFRIPKGEWTIRAAKGMRRGSRQLVLNGRHLDAQCGLVPIHEGDEICLGNFRFIFHQNQADDLALHEDPKELIESIERWLKQAMSTIPVSSLPAAVVQELSGNAGFSWENAYLRHYEQAVEKLIGSPFVAWTAELVSSRTACKKLFGSLNRIRNVAFHPSRDPLSNEDRHKLAEAYLRFSAALSQLSRKANPG